MDIYWLKDKKKCGPATVPDVISRIELGELTEDSLGWHAGCKTWVPLKELPAMADFLHPQPAEQTEGGREPAEGALPADDAAAAPADGQEEAAAQEATAAEPPLRLYLPTAGMRALARLTDTGLYAAVIYAALYLRGVPFNPLLLPSSPVFWLPFIVLEATMITFFGSTPGKLLFGIRVGHFGQTAPQAPLTFLTALNRSFLVFVGGMGMMFSILPLITGGISLWQLKRRGITLWDARCATLPVQPQPCSPFRGMLAALILVCCLHTVGVCMEPWMPAIISTMQEQSPEMANWLQQMQPK